MPTYRATMTEEFAEKLRKEQAVPNPTGTSSTMTYLLYGADAEGVPAFMFYRETDPVKWGEEFAKAVGGTFSRVALEGIDFDSIEVLDSELIQYNRLPVNSEEETA